MTGLRVSVRTAPLRAWTYIGLGIALVSLSYATFIVFMTLVEGVAIPGYASLLVAVLFMGSLQLISIGILGEYVGRAYLETKRRPKYVIRKIYGTAEKNVRRRKGVTKFVDVATRV